MVFGRSTKRQRAFTLIELLVVIAIVALLVGILLPALAEARKVSRKSVCESNLHQHAIATNTYGADFKEAMFSFTGLPGGSGTALQQAAQQAWAILRDRTGRDDWFQNPPANWIPHILYQHLVLNEYLQQRLPEKMVVCPDDKVRAIWQSDPYEGYDALPTPGIRPGAGSPHYRWPFSSSYRTAPASFSPDAMSGSRRTVSHAGNNGPHNLYMGLTAADGPLGDRKLSDVSFPSQKVLMYDQYDRHTSRREIFHAYGDARCELVMADGSVQFRFSRDANRGFYPNEPNPPRPVGQVTYTPDPWEPPTRNGGATNPGLFVGYSFTRGGLKGVDFSGTEIRDRR